MSKENVDSLENLRAEIDQIDQQLQLLLNQRADCAQRVASVKLRDLDPKQSNASLFYRPEREAQVLRKVIERNEGPLDGKDVARIFREVIPNFSGTRKSR